MEAGMGVTDPGWLALAVFFLGTVLFLSYLQQKELRLIQQKYCRKEVLLADPAVSFLGFESDRLWIARSRGSLVLTRRGLYYLARFSTQEFFLPAAGIVYVGITCDYKNNPFRQALLTIHFITVEGKAECAAFRLHSPQRWEAAVKVKLLGIKNQTRTSS